MAWWFASDLVRRKGGREEGNGESNLVLDGWIMGGSGDLMDG